MHVVTTPTGQIGSQLVQNLLASNESVRVIVRDAKKLKPEIRDMVEVVEGKHDDESILMKALEGAESFFLLVPPSYTTKDVVQYHMQFAKPACNAIKKQKVKRVVSISGICHGLEFKAGPVSACYLKDVEIEKTGVDYRALWCPGFMDNMLRQIEPLKHKGMFFGVGKADLKLPLAATKEIAESGAKLLIDKTWTGQGGLAVLGPEDLSCDDMSEILTDVLGKTIRYQRLSSDDYKAQLMGVGATEEFAQAMLDMFDAKDNGLDAEPRTHENTTKTSFRQWAKENLLGIV